MNTTGTEPDARFIAIAALVVDANQHVGIRGHELRRQDGKTVERSILVTVVDDHIASLDIAELTQALLECLEPGRICR
jgi:hypothetical protein